MKIIVSTQQAKDSLLAQSEYVHWLECIDSDKAGTLMHIYTNPDMIEVVPDLLIKEELKQQIK